VFKSRENFTGFFLLFESLLGKKKMFGCCFRKKKFHTRTHTKREKNWRGPQTMEQKKKTGWTKKKFRHLAFLLFCFPSGFFCLFCGEIQLFVI
jgi:hypothetical protein